MNVLEAFYFTFSADASKLDEALRKQNQGSKDLEKNLETVDKRVAVVNKAFRDLAESVGKAVAGVLTLGTISTVVKHTNDHTYAVWQQAKALGVTTNLLSRWQQAVQVSGGTAQGAANSMKVLRDRFVEMQRFGMANADTFVFHGLGMSTDQMRRSIADPTIAMVAIAKRMETLTPTGKLFLGQQLGLDQGTINLLSRGEKAVKELLATQERYGVVTQKQADAVAHFRLEQKELGLQIDALTREAIDKAIPGFEMMLHATHEFLDYIIQNKGFVKAFVIGLAGVITAVYLPAAISAAIATWAWLAPIIAIPALCIALAAGIGLLFDDLEHYMNGQDSLIGRLSKKYPEFGEIMKKTISGTIADWHALEKIVGAVFDYIKAVFKLLTDSMLKGPSQAIKEFGDSVVEIWGRIKSAVTGAPAEAARNEQDINRAQGRGPNAPAAAHGEVGKSNKQILNSTGVYVAEQLEKMGWSKANAQGIAGSLYQESNLDPHKVNPKSGAYGIAQWLGPRRADFEAWAGHSIYTSTLDEQIAFLSYEMTQGKEQAAGRKIRRTTTPEAASVAHSRFNERPGWGEANEAAREQYAEIIAQAQAAKAATGTAVASEGSHVVANGAISNRLSHRNTSVTIGKVDVNTQASDPQGVKSAIAEGLHDHLRSVTDAADDGVEI